MIAGIFLALSGPLLSPAHAGPDPAGPEDHDDPGYVWSIEPIKLSSLMLNVHPDWAAWGIETGFRVTDNLWLQLFFEYDKASGSLGDYFADGHDYLVTQGYTAIMPTGRWYFTPGRSSGFVDVGFAFQRGRQQWLDPARELQERSAVTLSPVLLSGYEFAFGRGLFCKIRGGGGWNAYRSGGIDGQLDLYAFDEQRWTYYNPHAHLTEVLYQPFFYIGDVAFGARFGKGRRKRRSPGT